MTKTTLAPPASPPASSRSARAPPSKWSGSPARTPVRPALISESFGLPVLDSDGIRDLHEKLIVDTAEALNEGLGERAMQIHLQRIVGAYRRFRPRRRPVLLQSGDRSPRRHRQVRQ